MRTRNLRETFFRFVTLAAVAVILPGAAAGQAQTEAAVLLEITGGPDSLTLSAADLKALPRVSVRVGGQNGQVAQVYEGVTLSELLRRAGVPQGTDFGGDWLAAYLAATAEDGYQVVFSLGELTSGMGSTEVLVADTVDGTQLPDGQGPLRLIVPTDKRAARWVRMLEVIQVENAPN